MRRLKIYPGKPYPLGSYYDGAGVNFAIFSKNAEKVELCLFDNTGAKEISRIVMPEYTAEVWHCYIPDIKPGQLYGYRVYGSYEPKRGHRFNNNKLLIDPYAKKLSGNIKWNEALFSYKIGDEKKDLSFSKKDSAKYMPKCEVIDENRFLKQQEKERKLNINSKDLIIYELHVKGYTKQFPGLKNNIKGTIAGLMDQKVIDYLKDLGVNAVELLPIHSFFGQDKKNANGLPDYWGYNTVNYFSLEQQYLSNGNLEEFYDFVSKFHKNGIEVFLDVVFNHTAEGNELGPTFSFRGIDNKYYYSHPEDLRYYNDWTGCGNSLNIERSFVTRMVVDSLRYFRNTFGIDGFRFDLATVLGRKFYGYDKEADFFNAVRQDPSLAEVKLIAEPWDVGYDGYQLGNFPPEWFEWNGRYRDTARRFWKGEQGQAADFASRLAGSSDLFDYDGRRPYSSVNFITAHDGFTLNDLVSYNTKHNDLNNENNADGANDNASYNYGFEGETNAAQILDIRRRQVYNFFATLLLSQGVPMFTAGDEFLRTQKGNNNAYCQDNDISWVDWKLLKKNKEVFEFVKGLINLRKKHAVFNRTHFFVGDLIPGTDELDIVWLRSDGLEMQLRDWVDLGNKKLCFMISGDAGDSYHLDKQGKPVTDRDFLVILNADDENVKWQLPKGNWVLEFDTYYKKPFKNRKTQKDDYLVRNKSVVVFSKD